jgi:hypothetical protein
MSAAAPLPALVPIPAVSDALGFSESRPTYRALERFGIPIVYPARLARVNSREHPLSIARLTVGGSGVDGVHLEESRHRPIVQPGTQKHVPSKARVRG